VYVEGETATGWGVADYFTFQSLDTVPVRDDWQRLPPDIILPDAVTENIRTIFQTGQQSGNHRDVFSKVGDSITANPFFLAPIADGSYNLGDHQGLHRPIRYFTGIAREGRDSFSNNSLVSRITRLRQPSVGLPMPPSILALPIQPGANREKCL